MNKNDKKEYFSTAEAAHLIKIRRVRTCLELADLLGLVNFTTKHSLGFLATFYFLKQRTSDSFSTEHFIPAEPDLTAPHEG